MDHKMMTARVTVEARRPNGTTHRLVGDAGTIAVDHKSDGSIDIKVDMTLSQEPVHDTLAASDKPRWSMCDGPALGKTFTVDESAMLRDSWDYGVVSRHPPKIVTPEGRLSFPHLYMGKPRPRPFFKAAIADVYAQAASTLKTEMEKAIAAPDYLIWGAGKSEVAQNLLRIYRPLKVVPMFHEGIHRGREFGDMSMKTTVAIVGSGYHPGASDTLRNLERQFTRKVDGPFPNAHKAKLVLKREPDNSHDPNAVAVTFLGKMLGYVPRQDAKVVAKVMDAGVAVRANYNGGNTMSLWWPASTKEGVDAAYRIAMAEGEGL